MKRSLTICAGLFVGFLLTAGLVAAQEKGKAKERQDRLDGRIQMINKDASTITIRMRSGNATRQIVYNSNTKIGKFAGRGNPDKPASADDLKDGQRIIAVGKFNDKAQLEATQISIREGM